MSKSLNTFIPVLGGTALVLGLAYGVTSRQYGAEEIAALETRIAQSDASAAALRQGAEQAATQVAELETQIAELQAVNADRLATGTNLTAPAPARDELYGLGRSAHPEEILSWDVDVLPDGRGLPEGSGDVFTGEEVFVEKCGACHGDFAEGVDNWPVLAGGFDTLADEDPVKTVGSYWPYLSTVWDYVHRSMPFGEAGTLSADETYAIVAYILYSNDLVDDEFELSRENFLDVEMHNADGFVVDDRPELEYSQWRAEPCMENCKEEVEVTMRSVFLVETPPEGGSNSVMNHGTLDGIPTFTAAGPSFIPEASQKANDQAEVAPALQTDAGSDTEADLVAAGEKVFNKCKSCHQVGAGAKNRTGPQLNGIFGRVFGSVDGFRYSAPFQAALEEGRVWDEANMAEFLAAPKSYISGTKMSFSGLRKDEDIAAVSAYLKSFGE